MPYIHPKSTIYHKIFLVRLYHFQVQITILWFLYNNDKLYLFDNKDYPFYKGTDQVTTGILFKDILVDRVEKDQTIK